MSATKKFQEHPYVKQASATANDYVTRLDKELTKYPILTTIEQKTQVPKAFAVLGAVTVLVFSLLVNSLAQPVSNLIGWALPAYLSFKAIESPGAQDDVQWLTYWVVFGSFNFLESIGLSVLLYYLPWYFTFKTAFILWLQLPAFRGAQVTYHTLLKPVLANVKDRVPPVTSHSTATASELREKVNDATGAQ